MRTRFAGARLVWPLVACLAGSLVACGGDDGGAEGGGGGSPTETPGDPVSGGDLTFLYSGAGFNAFEPADVSNEADSAAAYLGAVFGMLVYEDYETGEVVPSMAESLTASDSAHWVLGLREDVTFSDGTPFDAEAVKFNWERAAGLAQSPVAPVAAQIASLTVADPLTLEIELAAPDSTFDRTVARNLAFVGSPTALQADEASFLQSDPVGAGPFVVTSIGADGTAEFDRNPEYWDQPKPYLDHLTIRFVSDDEQRLNTFLSGDAQLMGVGITQDVSSITEGTVVEQGAPGGGSTLIFNTAKAPFDSETARLAVQHAINRDEVNEIRYSGRGRVESSIFTDDSPFHDAEAEFPAFDPGEAQSLFDEYADETGEPMSIQFTAPQAARATAELFQAQLQEFDNVEVELNVVDGAQYFPGLLSGAFDVAVFSWAAANPLSDFRTFYETGGPLNLGGYSNPEVDRLLAEAAATTDEAEQADLLKDVQEIVVNDDAVAYFLVQTPSRALVADDVLGLDSAVDGIWLWDRVSLR